MPQLFSCPHCQVQTLVDDEYLGRSGPCFQCGQQISVGHGRTTAATSDAAACELNRRKPRWGMWLMVALACVLGGFACCVTFAVMDVALVPVVKELQMESASGSCAANLKRIHEALEKYHEHHGCYPPAYSVDSMGKPLLSWRVHLLPYLGESTLHSRFILTEPWNSTSNSQLVKLMPSVFGCPLRPDQNDAGETSYMILVGPNTAFQGSVGVKKSAITDDPSLTILVVESEMVNVDWTAPIDIEITKISLDVNGANQNGIGSEHRMGAHVLTADGRAKFLFDATDAETLRGLSTINGDETLDDSVFRNNRSR